MTKSFIFVSILVMIAFNCKAQTIEKDFYLPVYNEIADSIIIKLKYLDEDVFASRDYNWKDLNIEIKGFYPNIFPYSLENKLYEDYDLCVLHFDSCFCSFYRTPIVHALYRGFHRYLTNKPYDIYEELELYLDTCYKFKEEFENRRRRWVVDSINGIYVPKNIEEAIEILINIAPNERLLEIKNKNEDDVVPDEYNNMGLFIRNYFKLSDASRLKAYIIDNYKIYHPDDISSIMLIILYRKLNNLEFNIREVVEKLMLEQNQFQE